MDTGYSKVEHGTVWRKALIKESRFPTLVLRSVWGCIGNPMPMTVRREDGALEERTFFIVNVQDPYTSHQVLGFAESDLEWEDETRNDDPPCILRATWLNPQWPGL